MRVKYPEKGDHIWSPDYNRYGIYDGNGSVFHLSKTSVVTKTSLSQFVGSPRFYIRRVEPRDLPETIVRRAKCYSGKRINHPSIQTPEQFAVWCECGQPKCMQIQIWVASLDKPKRSPVQRVGSGGKVAVLQGEES